MSEYRFWTTDIVTGRITSDWVPLVVQSASAVLCGIGELRGYLLLQTQAAKNMPFLKALKPRRTFLWVSQDGLPVWVGVLWDKPHTSAKSMQVPISAKTVGSLFARRLITGALSVANTDILDIARQIINYGLNPQLGQNTAIAGLQLSTNLAGVLDTWTFGTSNTIAAGVNTYYGSFSDYQATSDALSSISSADGFEWDFAPVTSDTGSGILLRLGYPHLGVATPQWTLQYPGGNAADYAYPQLGSNSANQLIGTSTANGASATYISQAPHGIDQADLDAGVPLLQQQVSWPGQGVTSQAQINAYVDALLPAYKGNTTVPQVEMVPDRSPLLREVGLGDALNFAATSPYHPANPVDGSPGLQLTGRLTGWELVPPAENQAEKTTFTLGSLSGYVSTSVA